MHQTCSTQPSPIKDRVFFYQLTWNCFFRVAVVRTALQTKIFNELLFPAKFSQRRNAVLNESFSMIKSVLDDENVHEKFVRKTHLHSDTPLNRRTARQYTHNIYTIFTADPFGAATGESRIAVVVAPELALSMLLLPWTARVWPARDGGRCRSRRCCFGGYYLCHHSVVTTCRDSQQRLIIWQRSTSCDSPVKVSVAVCCPLLVPLYC